MTLSVAMAVYNGATYLREQLDSIARQSRPPDELVICDNCSTDDSLRIGEAFAASVPFPVLLRVQATNVGVGQNFASAISLCRGDVICLADCDDVWYPAKLQRIEEVFSESPSIGLLFSDADLVDETLTPLGYSLHESCHYVHKDVVALQAGREAINQLIPGGFPIFGNTMAFREEVRIHCLPLPLTWAFHKGFHDIWLSVIIGCIADVAIVSDRLVAYRQHTGHWGSSPLRASLSTRLRRLAEPCDPRAAVVARLLVDRLNSMNVRENAVADALIILEAWSKHLSAREAVPTDRIRRVPLIWREIVSGRYRTFSKNLLSAAKDLVKKAGQD